MTNESKKFRTLRGFLKGEEPDEETYFAYSATLRIFGKIPDLGAISETLGVAPTNTHRIGDSRGSKSPPYKDDHWSFTADVPESEPLENHINALWAVFKPNRKYLLKIKDVATVDVFIGYRTNHDHAGIEVPHTCLEMFTELKIPFGISIIIA